MSLKGKVAVVTGASRGVGRGIALQLGEAGATVYVTGRDPTNRKVDPKLPTLEKTAKEITQRGGEGIPVYVDHTDDAQVKALFEKVASENNGQLDILVNNAFSALYTSSENLTTPFWEVEPELWDTYNNVGLRGYYVSSLYAARLFVKNARGGLIVNISSKGAEQYIFNVPYGVGKAAVDRLTADTAHELKPHKVTVVSLWPGGVQNEVILNLVDQAPEERQKIFKGLLNQAETTEYAGKAVVALATDSKALDKTGKALRTTRLGKEYGFKDIDGRDGKDYIIISLEALKKEKL
uniref:Dehydrogenase/reductase SDR family member 1 n=1 Tax=Acrobeloides nanus TaxID=290746 RepID=A0A914D0H8_9BILA